MEKILKDLKDSKEKQTIFTLTLQTISTTRAYIVEFYVIKEQIVKDVTF